MHLHWIDIAIVLVYIGGVILVGVLSRTAIRGISDFLVAGRTLNVQMGVATYVATGLGLVTFSRDATPGTPTYGTAAGAASQHHRVFKALGFKAH